MVFRRRQKVRRRARILLGSLSDISFLLLIFVMLIALSHKQKKEGVHYPEAYHYENLKENKRLEIWIDRQGNCFYNNEKLALKEVESLFAVTAEENPDVMICIFADQLVPYRYVDGIVSILNLLQYRRVSFMVKERAIQ